MKRLNYFYPVLLSLFLTCGVFPFGPSDAVVPTIFFSAHDIGHGIFEIYSVKIDGSNFTLLTERDNHSKFSFSLSSVGKKISYGSDSDIFTMDIDGSNKRQLTFAVNGGPAAMLYASPSWSPDGSKIAFVHWTTGPQNIFIMNADGSNSVQITDSPEPKNKPQWMPDGSQIYFNSRDGLFILDSDGSNFTQLTDFNLGNESLLYPSNDRSFYFIFRADNQYLMYTIDIDGSGLKLVRSFSEEKIGLVLSPNLQYIAYTKKNDPEEGIYIMNFDGSGEKLLTRTETFQRVTGWSPDSQYILYTYVDNTPVVVWQRKIILNVIRPDGTDQALITDQINRWNRRVFWLF